MAPRPFERLAPAALLLLLVLPWVHPFSSGPSRNAWPWLISAACLAGVLLLRRHLQPRLCAQAVLVAAWISCAMALAQYFGLSPHLAPWVWPAGPGDGFANLRQRNHFGSLTALGLAALLAWVCSRRRDQAPALPAWASGLILAWLAAGLAASQSRTGFLAWLAVALGFALFAFWRRRQGAGLAWAAVALACVAALALPQLLPGAAAACALADCGLMARFAQTGQDSRLALWSNVLSLIAQRPWTGWGWGELAYAHFMTLFEGPRFGEKPGNAHNLPLHLAAELGLPVAMLVCLAVGLGVWRACPWRERDPWRWGAWCALGVIALHSLLEYPLWYGPFQLVTVLCVAHLWRTRAGARDRATVPARRWPLDLGAAAFLALVLALGHDYLRVSQPYLPQGQRSAWFPGDALTQAQRSWWFRAYADFATLSLTPLTPANAQAMNALAERLLHDFAEPRVIDTLLDSAQLLGRSEQLAFYARRYEAAFPQAHAAWRARQPKLQPQPGT